MKEDKSKNNFMYTAVPTHIVAENIDEYIIPECQEACRALWDKNLFTFMCSNRDEGDRKYILLGQLSKENEEIFKQLMESDPEHYFFSEYRETYGIGAYGSKVETAEILINLTEPFQMQDILEGYRSVNAFLRDECGICKLEVAEEVPSEPDPENYEDIEQYLKELTRYAHDLDTSGVRIVFDETQMTKSAEEYLQEQGVMHLYDPERQIVYDDKFYRDAHLRYVEYMKTINTPQTVENPAEIGVGDFKEAANNRDGILAKGGVAGILRDASKLRAQTGNAIPEQGKE